MNPEEAAPQPPQEPIQETPKQEGEHLAQIRTYQGDIADILHTNKESLVSIQHQEQVRRASVIPPQPAEEENQKSWVKAVLLFIGSIVLIAGAAAAGWYSYSLYKEKTKLPEVSAPANRFFPVSDTKNTDVKALDRAALTEFAASEINAALSSDSGSIEQIRFINGTSTPLDTAGFLAKLQTQAPASLVRAFDPLFMYGIYGGTQPSAFLIIKLDSFPNAFPGMLSWESTLAQDIGPLFATSQNIQNLPPETSFTDTIIKNKDVRILLDQNGQTALLYSFYDNGMLIITDSANTLIKLEASLQNQELSR